MYNFISLYNLHLQKDFYKDFKSIYDQIELIQSSLWNTWIQVSLFLRNFFLLEIISSMTLDRIGFALARQLEGQMATVQSRHPRGRAGED